MTLDDERWPCPDVGSSRQACVPRLFLDEAHRAVPSGVQRRHAKGDATFRCRFYDRITKASPVEREGELRRTSHISVELRSNSGSIPLARRPIKLHLGEARVLHASTDDRGALHVADVPAGEYLLEIDDVNVFVTTLPPEMPAQIARVADYMTVAKS